MSEENFSGYQWRYFSSLQEGPSRSRAELFLGTVDWLALAACATKAREGIHCSILPNIGLGHNHMVRIIEFTDGVRWVARLRMPSLRSNDNSYKDISEPEKLCEFNTIALIQQRTDISTPRVHLFEPRSDSSVKAPFMLMDCLEGNVGMDLSMRIPPEHNHTFLRELAHIHVQLSKVQLPRIGTIVSINEDGTCQQGAIPGLGGPFNTATEFFKAWADKTKFGMTDKQLQTASGQYAAEIVPGISSFPKSIANLANRLSVCDQGPFPLCHGDFGHNNVIVDDSYHILGVIDWETAFAGPWELFGDFPLNLSIVPRIIDVPWNYDEEGNPKDPNLAQQFTDQAFYVSAVKEEETRSGWENYRLSEALMDSRRQQLVTAMRLYQRGKVGWYSKLTDDLALHI